MTSSITEEDQRFVETWENIAEFQNVIVRINRKGDEAPEVIVGRRTFMITTAERLITQEKVLDPKNDPFANGSFRPVNVPDSMTIEANPNALADEEIIDILGMGDFAWGEWLKSIDSPATLRRMITLADEVETLSHKRYRQLSERLAEVKPVTRIQSNDPEVRKFLQSPGGR